MGSLVAVDGGRSRCRAAVIGADGRPGPVAVGPGLPAGGGYWLVATDGGIFAFGDATFLGSTGSLKLNKPVVGMSAA